MSLELFLHPLSSYTQKVLIALYENDSPFVAKRLDEPAVAREWEQLSPLRRFPILRDTKRGRVIPESTIIIEYLQTHFPGRLKLIPADPDLAWQVRLRDRFFDNYLHTPMQKLPFDLRRPQADRDAYGVEEAKTMFVTALESVEAEMAGRTWAMAMSSRWQTARQRQPFFMATASSARSAGHTPTPWRISTV